MINLRGYQADFLQKIKSSMLQGHRRIMCVSPCGSGKSVVMQSIVESAERKHSTVMVIAHRLEIVEQLQARFNPYKNTHVYMVQTACRRLQSIQKPDIIIIDEAHTAKSNSYLKILEYFSNSYALYFTATPQRTDGKGFADIADDLIESVSVSWLIENNFLAPFQYYAPKILIDVDNLTIKSGEYDSTQATQMLDKPKIYGSVIGCYQKYAAGKKAIVYCSSVEHSIKTAAAFNSAGIPAAHIDGKTPKQERKAIIQDFRDGKIKTLCNYALIIEGFDVPDTGCVICLRPTKSLIVHIQSTMRCMRPAPGKTAVILDMVGNFERHGLPDGSHRWSLEAIKKQRNREQNTVMARTCKNCFRTYAGNSRICPYCGFDSGKTKQEIETDEKAELERITAENRKKKRMEVGRARTLEDLLRIAQERNYKPGWAYVKAKQKGIRI